MGLLSCAPSRGTVMDAGKPLNKTEGDPVTTMTPLTRATTPIGKAST